MILEANLQKYAALGRTEADMEGSGTQEISGLSRKCIQTRGGPPFLVLVLVWFQYLKLQL